MDNKYSEPISATDLRHCYEVAYGEFGANYLIGAMFANLSDETVLRLYEQGLDRVRETMPRV